jgi:hypothetical protein
MRSYSPRALEGRLAPDHPPGYYSNASALPSVSNYFLSLAGKRSVLVITLLCAIFAVAAAVSLPNTDDGLLLLTIREVGSKAIVNNYPENPLAGWLWQMLVESAGVYFWPLAILLNGFLWWILALEACYLWIRIFPEHHGFSPLIGCLTIAPVVVHTQTTLTLSQTAVLSTILGYLSLFVCLHHLERFRSAALAPLPALLLAFASISGDYGLSVGLVVFVLLIGSTFSDGDTSNQTRTRRMAWLSLLATTVAYGAGHFFFRFGASPTTVTTGHADFYGRAIGFPFNEFSAIWHVLIGAYGTLFGSMNVSWRSKTSLVSLLMGILFAWALTSKVASGPAEASISGQRVRTLLIALAAGLAPVVINHPYPIAGAYPRQAEAASRFFIPIMPLAACLTTSLCLPLVRIRYRSVLVSVVGLLLGFCALNQVWVDFRRQRLLTDIGTALRPYVEAAHGQTVGILSGEQVCFPDFSCTAKASASWPVELSKRFWIYNRVEATDHLGSRSGCKASADLRSGSQMVQRRGPVSKVLWVQVSGNQFSIEPYCLDAAAVTKTAPSMGATVPVRIANGLINGTFEHVKGRQDLTQLGTADWEHWTTASLSNHKASGNKQIAYYNTLGGVLVRDDPNAPVQFSWTDGMPNETEQEIRSGIAVGGHSTGFQIAAPADLTERTLWVYVGVRKAESKIQAKMTDSSTDDFVDTSLSSSTGEAGGMYKIVYRAGSPGQSLIVTFTQTSGNPQGSFLLQAAALAAGAAN